MEYEVNVTFLEKNMSYSFSPDGNTSLNGSKFVMPYFWQQQFALINLTVGNTIVAFLGLFGNILILFVLAQKKPHSSTDIYRMNLACADLMFTMIATIYRFIPLTIMGYDPLKAHPVACKIWIHLLLTFENISAWSIVFLTGERLFVVYFPLISQALTTRKKAALAMISIDIFWPLWYIPLYIVYGHGYKPGPGGKMILANGCTPTSDAHEGLVWYVRHVRPWLDAAFLFLVPFLIILISNILIIIKMVHHARFRASMAISMENPIRKNRSLTVTLLAVSFVFMLCVAPLRVMMIIDGHGPPFGMPVKSHEQAMVLLRWSFAVNLSRLNYSINFILYCLCSAEFRNDVKVKVKARLPCYEKDGLTPRSSRTSSGFLSSALHHTRLSIATPQRLSTKL